MKTNNESSVLNKEILTLKDRVKELEVLVKFYEDQFALSKKRQFGFSSEKSEYDQLSMDSMDKIGDPGTIPRDKEPDLEHVEEHYRKKKRTRSDSLPENIHIEEIHCSLPETEQRCTECDTEMEHFGNDSRKELVVIPAKVMIRRYVAHTYICRNCPDDLEQTQIKKAKWPNPVIKGSFASPESIAYAAHQKFVMGVPLYRQEQEWQRRDVLLSRQTMANWLIRAAKDWLVPIYDELKRQMLLRKVLHADETTFHVLKEPGKKTQSKGYLWCYRTSGDTDEPIVLAEYRPDRRNCNPAVFLQGYSGYLHSDGYDAYHKLPECITVVGCWAHVRRKWDDALKIIKVEDRKDSIAFKGKEYCDKLFAIERELAVVDSDMRYEERTTKLKPEIDEFYAWAWETRNAVRPTSPAGKAISYMFSQQQYLMNILLDGRLELSNNRVERTIKPFVISRKNFLFANTLRGAESAAVIFSLIETAKETGLDPFEYLTYVFKTAPNIDVGNPDKLKLLLPSNYKETHCS